MPQIPRDQWKDCEYNQQMIGCIDHQLDDGWLIIWKDGLRMTYKRLKSSSSEGDDLLQDTLGGIWRRQVLIQGNIVLTNINNGNRIYVPLRLTCRPPLKGKVGYCHY